MSTHSEFTLPQEELASLELRNKEDDSLSLAIVNTNLTNFEHKEFFAWECVVWIAYDKDEKSGLPTNEGYIVLNEFFEQLDMMLKEPAEHPNALFFVRIVGDGTAECVWMLNNPDIAEEKLNELIKSGEHPLEFEYQIEQDYNWENYSYFLNL